ncbi:hypothetical protein D049_0167A, partial [Vibrio parahaemolyticus VPTS-2010]
MPSSC